MQIKELGHLVLYVKDLARSRRFYGELLGWKEITLPAPVFAGDTLHAETEVLSVRDSQSRPGQGIVEVRTRGVNQRGETVIEFERSFLIARA